VISRFFIDRPIFAAVLSIVITLAGAIAGLALPIAQYPNIAPPTVQVIISYPGASARVVADTVAAPIEQQVNGVEGMIYMSSSSDNFGNYTLIVTFDLGTDLNTALVMVQNRVQLAVPQLPQSVQKQGLTIKKKTPNILLAINLISPDGRYDDLYLSNYATVFLKDELFRLEGVSDINYLGERDYSIRAWLNPDQLATRDMTASEVVNALKSQNLAAAPGQIGQAPASPGQQFQLPLDNLGRLTKPEQFGDVIIKVGNTQDVQVPQIVRLRDVARVELGAQQYDQSCTLSGRSSVALAMYQLPGTNALDVAKRIVKKMEELKKRFPEGLDYKIAYDTTPFIKQSIEEVFKTLRDAIILVAIVVLVFLQNWRAALIPLVAVPVAIVGTFAAMAALGFSLNNISLFGLVLAIGIVVDDAIVVVENVERWLEHGLSPRDAARKAMDEVTGPVVAVALVLCAVFVPCAFITGITGQFFKQFAITISVSTVISAFNSLTLSPALAALLLRRRDDHPDLLTRGLDYVLGWFFRLFNSFFNVSTNGYTRVVGWLLRGAVIVLLVFGGLLYATYWMFSHWPVSFIPIQDQGWLLVNVQLPDSSSVQRTQQVMKRLEQMALADPAVADTLTVSGQSILLTANSSNWGSMFVILKPFDQRHGRALSANAVLGRLKLRCEKEVDDALVGIYPAPPVPGIGTAGGFKIMVEDRGNLGLTDLEKYTNEYVAAARAQRGYLGVFTAFGANAPQFFMDINRPKVRSMGVSIDDVNQTLEVYLGSVYVNNFNEFGRYWQVKVMAEGTFRNHASDTNRLKVRNNKGQMVPLGALVHMRDISGPGLVPRYNGFVSAPVNGVVFPTVSSGQVVTGMDHLATTLLPRSMQTEWTDLMYQQIKAGNTAMYIFAFAVVMVFLVLAAQYESWSLPLAVILVVPMCLLCAVLGVAISHDAINIFTQIGLVVLVGLASKNAILIVEFAKQLREEGKPSYEATTQACRLRLRPIMMTSFAFILGVVPLVLAEGAGAEMRKALGIAVFSGMLGVTFFGIFLTPVFFHVIQWAGEHGLFTRVMLRRVGYALLLVLALAVVEFVRVFGFWGALHQVESLIYAFLGHLRTWWISAPLRQHILALIILIGLPAAFLLLGAGRRPGQTATTAPARPDQQQVDPS
jgi:hydrophobe/amphiphile efflux-1 (HAE1) family protein